MAKNIGRQNQILATNEVSQCAPKESNVFHFWERGGGVGFFSLLVVPDVFPSNSHCVPIKFSICLEHVLKISNVCPQHVSISTSLYLIHFALYIYSILVTYASRPKGRRPQYICFGTVQRAFLVTAFPMVVPHHREQPLGTQ